VDRAAGAVYSAARIGAAGAVYSAARSGSGRQRRRRRKHGDGGRERGGDNTAEEDAMAVAAGADKSSDRCPMNKQVKCLLNLKAQNFDTNKRIDQQCLKTDQ
jgi:hypothetical protein